MSASDCTFHDSYWYCYANSTAMLLSSIGEHISPRLIEALTGVGLGASFNPPLPYFGQLQPPDCGLTQALDLLGFGFDEEANEHSADAPLDRLTQGPAIVGPLDMSYLSYNPGRPRDPGVDHYVVILDAEDGLYRLHDPAGFAHVRIGAADLTAAWCAEAIDYRRGSYRSWRNPRRQRTPSADAIYAAAMLAFRNLYLEADQRAAQHGGRIGEEALLALASAVETGTLTPRQRGHLTFFGLPLGAKRALDYAAFFKERAPGLAEAKRRQAEVFGACQVALTGGKATEASDRLTELAALESVIKDAILHA